MLQPRVFCPELLQKNTSLFSEKVLNCHLIHVIWKYQFYKYNSCIQIFRIMLMNYSMMIYINIIFSLFNIYLIVLILK